MKKYVLQIFLFLYIPLIGIAQDFIFEVELSSDTLYIGNLLGLKYTTKNIQGDFQPPEFDGFDVVGGPNVSSQFSMINGTVSQSSSYEYVLRPYDVGHYLIPSASIKQGEDEHFSKELFITVISNPEGIRQDHRNYKLSKEVPLKKEFKPLSKEDSLKLKLRKIKSKKI